MPNFTKIINPPFITHPVQLSGDTTVLFDTIPTNVMQSITKGISSVKDTSKKLNEELAGAIDDEFVLPSSSLLNDYIRHLFYIYFQKDEMYSRAIQGLFPRQENMSIKITNDDAWVNFQKKGEYNPIHGHSGILSWVIWYKIPYDRQIEKHAGPGKKEEGLPHGQFHFYTPSFGLGNCPTVMGWGLDVDYRWEGTIAMFPSNLQHQVFPFYTSDEERITIAGNLYIDV
jgi:hypothetical protein